MTIANLSVRYSIANVDDFIEGHALDVSARGLCITGDRAIGVGTLVEFDVQISGNQSVLTGAGRVAWVRRASSSTPDRPPAIGVRFVELDEASQEVLRTLLDRKPDAGERYEEEPDSTRIASSTSEGGRAARARPASSSPGPRTPRALGGRPESHRPLPPVVAPPRRRSSLPPPTPRPNVPGASAPPALPAVTAPPRKAAESRLSLPMVVPPPLVPAKLAPAAAAASRAESLPAITPPFANPPDVSEQEEVDRLLEGPLLAQPAASPRTAPTIAAPAAEPEAIPVDVDVDVGDTEYAEPTVIVQRDSHVPPPPDHVRPTPHVVTTAAQAQLWTPRVHGVRHHEEAEPIGSRRSTHVVSEAPPPTSYEHDQGDTSGDTQRTNGRRYANRLALGGAVAMLSVGLVALGLSRRASRTSASAGLSAPAASASVSVVAQPPAQAPAAAAVGEGAAVEQDAVPTLALSSLPQAPVAHATDAGAVSAVPRARRAATEGALAGHTKSASCNPTFTLDAEGNKHFKPECFLH